VSLLEFVLPVRCLGCGSIGAVICDACEADLIPASPKGVALAPFAYDGLARTAVHALKFRGARPVASFLARAMAPLVASLGIDAVSWAPTSAARRRARGFDQAELLAGHLARHLERPVVDLLVRLDGPAQTGRLKADRLTGPHFVARGSVSGSVLLVDDVVTTGATMAAAAAALFDAGARSVRWAAATSTT
jgi:predicted amidophosphoribosyltransferase